MTAHFAAQFNDFIKQVQHRQEHPEVRLAGMNYETQQGDVVTQGKKKINGITKEEGVFWNGRLIIPSSLIPKLETISLETIQCITNKKGVCKEGQFYNNRLIRGSLIDPELGIYTGIFDEKEQIKEGSITRSIPYATYTFKGTFQHGLIENRQATQCIGTKTYAISKYQETGTFIVGSYTPFETKTDQKGRLITGKLKLPRYHLEGVFTYSPKGINTLCEGSMIVSNGSYMALGVFVNGVQIKGSIFRENIEEPRENLLVGREDLLSAFMDQDAIQDFVAFCNEQRSIPPFTLQLHE